MRQKRPFLLFLPYFSTYFQWELKNGVFWVFYAVFGHRPTSRSSTHRSNGAGPPGSAVIPACGHYAPADGRARSIGCRPTPAGKLHPSRLGRHNLGPTGYLARPPPSGRERCCACQRARGARVWSSGRRHSSTASRSSRTHILVDFVDTSPTLLASYQTGRGDVLDPDSLRRQDHSCLPAAIRRSASYPRQTSALSSGSLRVRWSATRAGCTTTTSSHSPCRCP